MLRSLTADHVRAGAAAARRPIAQEFLQALSRIHLGRINVPGGIDADLVQVVEIAGHAACTSETAQFLKTLDYLSPSALDRALELAETAVQLDADLPQARAQLGDVLFFKHRHDATFAEFERAFELNPNFIDHRFAKALGWAGEHTRAIEFLEANIHLDPLQPFLHAYHMGLAYMLKRYEDAVRWCRECASRLPDLQCPHVALASAYAQSGQLEEARAEAAEVLRINPGFTIERYKPLAVYKNPEDAEHRLDGMRKAGLPET